MLENKAAETGPDNVSWWLDWRGECCAIVASGPSVKRQDLNCLRDRIHVFAIKGNIDLCPTAEVVYGCDAHWWLHRKGLPEFKGAKLAYSVPLAPQFPGLHQIHIDRDTERLILNKPGHVGSGGNSGFQAFNLAVQFGATGILLIGFDMAAEGNSPHWYGRNDWPGCANPDTHNYNRWRKAFDESRPTVEALGIDVVNASPISAISAFRRAGLEDALRGWGL
jgi:hypothetical protein